MELVSSIQQAILAFVTACNQSGYKPLVQEVEQWLKDPEPEEAVYRTERIDRPSVQLQTGSISRMIEGIYAEQLKEIREHVTAIAGAGLSSVTLPRERRVEVSPAEGPVSHLVRIGWLETVLVGEIERIQVTELGDALLRALERHNQDDPEVGLVVLDREDPLAYPRLVGRLHEAGAGLLVDPYLEVDALHHVVVSTRLSRLLVLDNGRNGSRLGAITTYLGGRLTRPIQVRSSPDLHDRVVISEDAEVLTIGSSLNGLHKHTTMIVPVPSAGAPALVEYYDNLWKEARSLGEAHDEEQTDSGTS